MTESTKINIPPQGLQDRAANCIQCVHDEVCAFKEDKGILIQSFPQRSYYPFTVEMSCEYFTPLSRVRGVDELPSGGGGTNRRYLQYEPLQTAGGGTP